MKESKVEWISLLGAGVSTVLRIYDGGSLRITLIYKSRGKATVATVPTGKDVVLLDFIV